MSKIIGITVGTQLPKPNFDQTDPSKGDYIKGDRSFLTMDATLTQTGHPADAKAVGDALANINGIPDIPQTQLIYEETLTMEYMTNTWITSGLIPLVVGNKYQITIEDKTFSAVTVTGQWDADTPIAVLGNGSLYVSDMEDTGEPYCILAAFNPIDVGGASLLGGVIIDDTVWPNKESVYLKIEEGSPNHLMLTTNENGEMVWEEKTHYSTLEYIIPETTFTIEDIVGEGFGIRIPFEIIAGKKYTVFYNGVEYEAIGQLPPTGLEGAMNAALGNLSIFEEEDNGLPFLIASMPTSEDYPGVTGLLMVFDVPEDTNESQFSCALAVATGSIKKLDPKFIDIPAPESDWNANEGEVGYIKNRTHGVGKYVEYFPEMEVQLIEGDDYPLPYYKMTAPMSTIEWIEFGKFFTITYNGVDYNCEFIQEGTTVGAGNLKLAGLSIGNNEPFILIGEPIDYDNVEISLLSLDKSAGDTVTLKISNDMTRVMKLDKKFLPDGLFYMEYEDSVEIARGATNPTYEGTMETTTPLEENKEYIIIIQGQEYKAKCKKYTVEGLNFLYLGNLATLGLPGLENTGELFIIADTSWTESGSFGYNYSASLGYGQDIVVKTAPINSKIPSRHLPTPNWSARKGEEGYIENRTHYHTPGITASWDGIIEGKETSQIVIGDTDFTCYKILDDFSAIDPALLWKNKGKIVIPSSGVTGVIFPLWNNKNGDFIHFFDLDAPSDGILSASSTNITLTFGDDSISISVPSSGLYYIKLSTEATGREPFDVIIEDDIKTLDLKYTSNTNLSIISEDYDAWLFNKVRVENPSYYCNLTWKELLNLINTNRLGAISLYYTNSTSDSGRVISVEKIDIDGNYLNDQNTLPEVQDVYLYCRTAAVGNKYLTFLIFKQGTRVEIRDIKWNENASSSIELDTTLKVSGKAADAKAVGDAIREAAFSGDYNDLTNKPTIPSVEGLATESYVDSAVANLAAAPRTSIVLSDTVTGQAYNLYIANGELKIKEVEA